eukprot:14734539-Heterocapsa_arctica.AAC.1
MDSVAAAQEYHGMPAASPPASPAPAASSGEPGTGADWSAHMEAEKNMPAPESEGSWLGLE